MKPICDVKPLSQDGQQWNDWSCSLEAGALRCFRFYDCGQRSLFVV